MPSTWTRCSATSPPRSATSARRRALLRGTGSDHVHLLVVCTAERGLCGPFNSAIVRLARERANTLLAEGKEVKIFCVGRKGYEQLRRRYEKQIIEHIELRAVRTIGFANAEEIGDRIVRLYEEGAFDVCTLFFSRFKSVIAQIPTAQQIIPPVFDGAAGNGNGAAYEYEPDEEEILAELLPRNIAVQIFRALLENAASFYGAQMSAMDNATRNAGEMIRKQTLNYNRTRQAMITKELIEIISGAEALSSTFRVTRKINGHHNQRRRDASPRSSAPSSTCSSTATCRRSSTRSRPRTRATAWCSRSPSISANRPCAPSRWTPAKAWCAARRSPTPASRSRCRSATARSAASSTWSAIRSTRPARCRTRSGARSIQPAPAYTEQSTESGNSRHRHQGRRPARALLPRAARSACSAAPASARP